MGAASIASIVASCVAALAGGAKAVDQIYNGDGSTSKGAGLIQNAAYSFKDVLGAFNKR